MAQNEQQLIKMPLLALRGLHVFPGMLLTFDVERPASIAALNNAVRADQLICRRRRKSMPSAPSAASASNCVSRAATSAG